MRGPLRKRTVYRFSTTSPRLARAIRLLFKDAYFVQLVELFNDLKAARLANPLLHMTHYLGERRKGRG